jgi:hypothetical protein
LTPYVEIEVRCTSKQDELASLVLADADRGEIPVPACPGWKVRDVCCALTGTYVIARESWPFRSVIQPGFNSRACPLLA